MDKLSREASQKQAEEIAEHIGKSYTVGKFGDEGYHDTEQEFLTTKYDLDDKEWAEAEKKFKETQEAIRKAEEQKETKEAKESRIRRAKWAPLVKKGGEMMQAQTLADVIGLGIEGAGDVMLAELSAEDAEIAREAGIRKASVEEALTQSKIFKNVSRGDEIQGLFATATALAGVAPKASQEYTARALAIMEEQGLNVELIMPKISALLRSTTPIALAGDEELTRDFTAEDFKAMQLIGKPPEELENKKAGGAVGLAKGGTPVKSFDFVPRGGKLVAVPRK
jgi:hypothetical protein